MWPRYRGGKPARLAAKIAERSSPVRRSRPSEASRKWLPGSCPSILVIAVRRAGAPPDSWASTAKLMSAISKRSKGPPRPGLRIETKIETPRNATRESKRSRDREGASFLECIGGDRMFAQIDRPLILTTPLGKDALLLLGFQGREAISEMFRFELQTAWEDQKNLLPFDQLLGKKVTIEMTYSANKRYINGMVSRITQGFRDDKFTYYVLEIVPELWLLGRKQDCRTFQQIAVPDILRKVLTGLDVSYQIQQTLQPREYCVQYNETDLAFVSRLMEEEGIFYFFKHSASGHQLVLADSPLAHPAVPYLPTAAWEDGTHVVFEENRVSNWSKQQEIRSGKFTTWGHNFQLPKKHLDAVKPIVESVSTGGVSHKLNVAGNDQLEIYEYPGGYATRFDAVTKTGGDQSANLQHLFDENQRIANIRMQEEAAASMLIRSEG